MHDPVVQMADMNRPHIEKFDEPLAALHSADALLILTAWPEYRAIAPIDIAIALAGRIVLDPYGVLNAVDAENAGLKYWTLGRSSEISNAAPSA